MKADVVMGNTEDKVNHQEVLYKPMMPIMVQPRSQSIGILNIGRFITRLLPALGYSIENKLKQKWKYLKSASQYYGSEVMRFSAYFLYPLEKYLKQRHKW